MDNMIFTSEVCGVVLIAPFDKISRPPCSTIRFIVFLSLFFRCFYPFFLYHRTFLLTVDKTSLILNFMVHAACASCQLQPACQPPAFRGRHTKGLVSRCVPGSLPLPASCPRAAFGQKEACIRAIFCTCANRAPNNIAGISSALRSPGNTWRPFQPPRRVQVQPW